MKRLLRRAVALGLAMTWGTAGAAQVYLCAGTTNMTMPDGSTAPMWGYAANADGNWGPNCDDAVQVPGPLLNVPVGDPNLTVHLTNHLPAATSLVMPGQATSMSPTFVTDVQGRQRVMSLTHETAPGAAGTYSWADVQPGSYVYHSGTHMAVQVQMGLYGGMRKDQAASLAYDGVAYDQEINLFYSEVDPVLHAAVADGSYGTTGPTSTLNYQPRHFLVKAMAQDGTEVLPELAPGQNTLLRLYNMGLTTVTPSLLNQHLAVVAEDGTRYPHARRQYSVMLAAGKTRDALFIPAATGSYALFDSRTGPYSFLQVAAAAAGTVATVSDGYTMEEDTNLVINAPGVLANDSGVGTLSASLFENVSQGSLTLNADGSFSYTSSADFNGIAQFRYRASDDNGSSTPETVTITVTPVNDAPVAVADAYATAQDMPLNVPAPGVLVNDSDIDSAVIEVNAVASAPGNGSVSLAADGGFTYTPNAGFTGEDSFSYTARDGAGAVSTAAVVTITVTPTVVENQPPVAVNDNATTKTRTPVVIDVLVNDTDDGGLDASTVTIVRAPNVNVRNQATVNPDGTITFTPHAGFRGSETFVYTVKDNEGLESNEAIVRVDVVK